MCVIFLGQGHIEHIRKDTTFSNAVYKGKKREFKHGLE
jgi:hypothetical protein